MTLQPVACYRCGRVGRAFFTPAVRDAARESGLWRCGAREACEQRQAANWRALKGREKGRAMSEITGRVSCLGNRAVLWHTERFPHAQAEHVFAKAVAELGEVADSMLVDIGVNSTTGRVGDGVTGEAADVVIALLVLIGRFYATQPDELLNAVEHKLLILEDARSDHPSSLQGS